jgi:hypothetical protein
VKSGRLTIIIQRAHHTGNRQFLHSEIEGYLGTGPKKAIVVEGSTGQRGPHLPVSTDVLVSMEAARRVAPELGALIALAEQGLGEIIFLNGRCPNAWTIFHSLSELEATLPKDTVAFGLSYWDALPPPAGQAHGATARRPPKLRGKCSSNGSPGRR